MGKKCDFSDFERGMVVATRRGGMSISETAYLEVCSCTTISWVNTFSLPTRDVWRYGLVPADRNTVVTQITTGSNQGLHKSISECTIRPTLRQMYYSSKRTYWVPLLSAQNRKLSHAEAQTTGLISPPDLWKLHFFFFSP
uniref:Uncharacterized protein n=1 Tax=Oryzias melastigma TaxID=30732 RepID=A0A3B3D5L7_ORYME